MQPNQPTTTSNPIDRQKLIVPLVILGLGGSLIIFISLVSNQTGSRNTILGVSTRQETAAECAITPPRCHGVGTVQTSINQCVYPNLANGTNCIPLIGSLTSGRCQNGYCIGIAATPTPIPTSAVTPTSASTPTSTPALTPTDSLTPTPTPIPTGIPLEPACSTATSFFCEMKGDTCVPSAEGGYCAESDTATATQDGTTSSETCTIITRFSCYVEGSVCVPSAEGGYCSKDPQMKNER